MLLTNEQHEELQGEIDRFCARMVEMGCGSIQIFATAHLVGNQWTIISGSEGNLYASYGAVVSWLKNQEEDSIEYWCVDDEDDGEEEV